MIRSVADEPERTYSDVTAYVDMYAPGRPRSPPASTAVPPERSERRSWRSDGFPATSNIRS